MLLVKCSKCNTPLAIDAKFCSACGTAVPSQALPVPPERDAFCRQCGSAFSPDDRFCRGCGAETAPPVSKDVPQKTETLLPAAKHPQSPTAEFIATVNKDPTGLLAATIVFVVAMVLCWIAWVPLSWPGRIVSSLVPPGNCMFNIPGSFDMYFCSALVAGRSLAGPLAVIVLLFILRKRVAKGVGWVAARMPKGAGPLLVPVVASLSFALCWSPIHYQIAGDSGLVSQTTFPAIVGLFAFLSTKHGPAIQRALGSRGFYERRDRIPRPLRMVVAILIPLTVSLLITFQQRVTQTALKEQLIVLLALCTGYLALTPRQGKLISGVRDLTARRKAIGG